MTPNNISEIDNLSARAYQYLTDNNYEEAINLYEHLISLSAPDKLYYWYLGLSYLLKGDEIEAQATWLLVMAGASEEARESLTLELIEVLKKEVNFRYNSKELALAWLICQHIKEIDDKDINNLLKLVFLSLEIGKFEINDLYELGIYDILQTIPLERLSTDLLILILEQLSQKVVLIKKKLFDFWHISLLHIGNKVNDQFIKSFFLFIYKVAHEPTLGIPNSIELCELYLRYLPNQLEINRTLSYLYGTIKQHEKSLYFAHKSYALSSNTIEKIYDNYLLIKSLLHVEGNNKEVFDRTSLQKSLILSLNSEISIDSDISNIRRLYNTTLYFSSTIDQPKENIQTRKQVAEFCQKNIESFYVKNIKEYREKSKFRCHLNYSNKQKIKIGYISFALKRHSVGWLSQSIFLYHNRDNFQLYAYLLLAKNSEDRLTDWYEKQSDKAYRFSLDSSDQEVAQLINQDEIDILIDLDSITFANTCNVMAMKPAPVQATWLGWDASSIPTIDYFIADPYVLPADAEDYYQEKIWRLPETYLAIDGFAVSVPSLKRYDLDIPDHAVVYFTSQMGHKYHPENIRLQMQILHEVPNSYFVIKSFGEMQQLEEVLIQIAESEGVRAEQIKFIKPVALEEIHRANLSIADIVLDTYPYNGATTTMETLWMGIPMVTKVGQQFAARNSYTMMINAGITEGIAWTDEEYVEWGIRLGKDENLRRDIAWKLKKNRQTAPLWNAKQFTRDMENAYQQMWQIYLDSGVK